MSAATAPGILFYITGWDTGNGNGNGNGGAKCTLPQPGSPPNLPPPSGGYGNEPFPGSGSSNGAIWGHWIAYTDPNAGCSGTCTFCDPRSFGVCTAQLSR